jgi:hypothetical protein
MDPPHDRRSEVGIEDRHLGLVARDEHRLERLFAADDLEACPRQGMGDRSGVVVGGKQDSGSFHVCPSVR